MSEPNQEIPAAIFDKAVVENAESSTTDGESLSVSGSEDVVHEKDAGAAYQSLIERLIEAKAKVANHQAMGIPMPAYMLSAVAQIEAEIKVADSSMPTRAEAVGRTAAAEANRLAPRSSSLIELIQNELQHQRESTKISFAKVLSMQKELHEVGAKKKPWPSKTPNESFKTRGAKIEVSTAEN